MADATPESNLALIEELQELVSADYTVPEGPEVSYPAVGQAVDDEMWQYITLALGDGVLALPGHPYWLQEPNNADNTMKLIVSESSADAQAVLKGFYHRMVEDMILSFPMPMTDTTYYVVLELNPLKAHRPEGPISVKVYPNELNTESGRKHLILWTVERKPNQLLTDAVITQRRPKIAPTLAVDTDDQLPPLNTVLWGTIVVVGGAQQAPKIVRAGGGNADGVPTVWFHVAGGSETYNRPDTATYKWSGSGYRPQVIKDGNTVFLRGRLAKTNGDPFYPQGNSEQGYHLITVPTWGRPKSSLRFTTNSGGSNTPVQQTVVVYETGEVRMFTTENTSLGVLDGCSWTLL